MLFYILYGTFYFIFDKVKNKIQMYFLNRTTKLILFRREWHNEQSSLNNLIDWILC